MSKRSNLLESISTTIADYRNGEIAAPTPSHVEEWINQFDSPYQTDILEEIDYVLKKTYIDRESVHGFITGLVKNKKIAGSEPCAFWKDVEFLEIQKDGNSQSEMIRLFDSVLQSTCGMSTSACGRKPKEYVYLDDAVFTGNRVLNDLRLWLKDAPKESKVHIIVMALHRGGAWYVENKLKESAEEINKTIHLTWWRILEIEDRKAYTYTSDVLRPTILPEDAYTQQYAASLKYPTNFRKPGSVGESKFFSSEQGRHILEQQLLIAGSLIRKKCSRLNKYQRPLGNTPLETLGFGSMLVTYRNCPNNCPLALWAGNPWYPLFPRKTN